MILRRGNVQDDKGGYAGFTDQGASTSHMTAARVLDTFSWFLGTSGEANDPDCLSLQRRNARQFGSASSKSSSDTLGNIDDPRVPLERNLNDHPLAGLQWERQLEDNLLQEDWEKVPSKECLYFIDKKSVAWSAVG